MKAQSNLARFGRIRNLIVNSSVAGADLMYWPLARTGARLSRFWSFQAVRDGLRARESAAVEQNATLIRVRSDVQIIPGPPLLNIGFSDSSLFRSRRFGARLARFRGSVSE